MVDVLGGRGVVPGRNLACCRHPYGICFRIMVDYEIMAPLHHIEVNIQLLEYGASIRSSTWHNINQKALGFSKHL